MEWDRMIEGDAGGGWVWLGMSRPLWLYRLTRPWRPRREGTLDGKHLYEIQCCDGINRLGVTGDHGGSRGRGDGEDIYAGDGMEGICYGYATDAPERERGIMCA